MKITTFVASFVLAGFLTIGAFGPPVSAHGVAQGKPYGCQINPQQAACQQAPKPAISNGNVTNVQPTTAGGAPSALPQSGGGAPTAPDINLAALLAAAVLLMLGSAARRWSLRRA